MLESGEYQPVWRAPCQANNTITHINNAREKFQNKTCNTNTRVFFNLSVLSAQVHRFAFIRLFYWNMVLCISVFGVETVFVVLTSRLNIVKLHFWWNPGSLLRTWRSSGSEDAVTAVRAHNVRDGDVLLNLPYLDRKEPDVGDSGRQNQMQGSTTYDLLQFTQKMLYLLFSFKKPLMCHSTP